MTLNSRSAKLSSPNIKVQDVPNKPTVTGLSQDDVNGTIDVAFTPATTGGSAAIYRAVSNPGNIEAISYGSSPVKVSGLSNNTAYTFTIKGETSTGATSGFTEATSSVTPQFGAMVPIATFNGDGSTRDVYFGNIPQNYKDLLIIGNVRSNQGSANDIAALYAGNYGAYTHSQVVFESNGSSLTSSRTTSAGAAYIGTIPANSATTGTYGYIAAHLHNYSSTGTFKTLLCKSAYNSAGTGKVEIRSGSIQSTPAITEIRIFPWGSGTAWMTGSTFTLYGIRG